VDISGHAVVTNVIYYETFHIHAALYLLSITNVPENQQNNKIHSIEVNLAHFISVVKTPSTFLSVFQGILGGVSFFSNVFWWDHHGIASVSSGRLPGVESHQSGIPHESFR
jgi:hypothetical protein